MKKSVKNDILSTVYVTAMGRNFSSGLTWIPGAGKLSGAAQGEESEPQMQSEQNVSSESRHCITAATLNEDAKREQTTTRRSLHTYRITQEKKEFWVPTGIR